MKKIVAHTIMAALIVAGIASIAAAEGRGCRKGKMLDRLTETLGLSEEQTETVESIMDSAREACSDAEDRQSMHACMKEQRDGIHEQINALLDDEQQAAFAELTAQIEEIGPMGHMIYTKLQEDTDATEEQLAAVKAVFAEAKGACEGTSDIRDCRRSQRDSVRTELQSILTDEQLKAVKPPHRRRNF